MFSSAMGNISNGEKFQLAWLERPEGTDVGVYPRSCERESLELAPPLCGERADLGPVRRGGLRVLSP